MKYEEWPLFVRRRHALDHISLVAEIGSAQPGGAKQSTTVTAAEVMNWLYSVLTTLDNKASALMRLNGVLIAAAAFLLGLFLHPGETALSITTYDARLIVLSALSSAVSIFLCLWIVNVSWPFLARVKDMGASTFDCTEELTHLDRACNFRQRMHRAAWMLSLFASFAFLLEFSHQVIHVLFTAK